MPSRSTWPLASKAIRRRSITSSCPMTAMEISARIFCDQVGPLSMGRKVDLGLARGGEVALGDENLRPMDLPSQIRDRLDALGILPGDVTEAFVRGSGAGGQKINKTSSTVVLRHAPTETEVRCQDERSQAVNRERAWERFCEKLEERVRAAEAARRSATAKAKRKARPKSRRQKQLQVAEKRHRAGIRSARKATE